MRDRARAHEEGRRSGNVAGPVDAGRSVGADRETAREITTEHRKRSTATQAQEQRLIEALREGPKTTDELRALGIFQPNARIWALRHKRGYEIITVRYDGLGADGYWHVGLARYALLSEPCVVADDYSAAHTAQKPLSAERSSASRQRDRLTGSGSALDA